MPEWKFSWPAAFRWGVQILIPLAITLAGQAVLFGKYVEKVDNLRERIVAIEAKEKEQDESLHARETDMAVTKEQYAHIKESLEQIRQTHIELVRSLNRK